MLKKKRIIDSLREGYSHLTVDKENLPEIPVEMAQGDEWYLAGTTLEKRKNHYSAILKPALVLTCLLIVFFGINTYQNTYRSFATIYLDVNPSIEVTINRNDKVLMVKALNEDAEKIIDGMDFRGSSLKVTLNALIGSLVRNGYINEVNNSVLVSIANTDITSGKQLENELLNEISSLIENGSVLSQQVYADDNVKALAEEYGISLGKAQLIIDLADSSGTYSYRELVGLTVHELNLLNKKTEDASTQRIGEPSDQGYIGINGAIQIALKHAGADESGAYIDEAEIEYDGTRLIYEVEFRFEGYEYDYSIDAISGTVLFAEKEKNDDQSFTTSVPSVDGVIDLEKVQHLALKHAGLNHSQIAELETELEYESGILKYEVVFVSGNIEYTYEIDAKTGEILEVWAENDDENSNEDDIDDYEDEDDDDEEDD